MPSHLITDFLQITPFIRQAGIYKENCSHFAKAGRCTKKVLSSGRKTHQSFNFFFQSISLMASILCHTQVSCCWATVLNGDFSWGDGNNSPTLFKQLTKHSISHLGISGCHPMDRHPQARSCKLAIFVIFSTQERCSWSHHHPLQLDLLVLNYLLNSTQSSWWKVHLSSWTPETGKRFCQSLASQP